MPYGHARHLPAPRVPSTDRLNLYPTPIADGTVVWTALKTHLKPMHHRTVTLLHLRPNPRYGVGRLAERARWPTYYLRRSSSDIRNRECRVDHPPSDRAGSEDTMHS